LMPKRTGASAMAPIRLGNYSDVTVYRLAVGGGPVTWTSFLRWDEAHPSPAYRAAGLDRKTAEWGRPPSRWRTSPPRRHPAAANGRETIRAESRNVIRAKGLGRAALPSPAAASRRSP